MTWSRIFASGTYEDPVVLSDSDDDLEVSQELTPEEEATVTNQTPTLSETLLVLLVVQLALSLQQN